jgi:isopentenyldiphosphate isomerase
VYIGHTNSPLRVDPAEIAGVRWVSPERLQAQLSQRGPVPFTPWFIMEWERVWNDHRPALVSRRS